MRYTRKKRNRKKRKRGGYNTRKQIKSHIRAAIIPHAGEKYAGEARKSIFKRINKTTRYIIYLAAVHRPQKSNIVYTLSHTSFKLPISIHQKAIPYDEHSQSNMFCNCIKTMEHTTHTIYFGEIVKVFNQNNSNPLLYKDGNYLT